MRPPRRRSTLAQDARDLLVTQRHDRRSRVAGRSIHSGAPCPRQSARSARTPAPARRRRFGIGAALEPVRRLRRQPQPLARPADGRRAEVGAFERDRARRRPTLPSRRRPSRRPPPARATRRRSPACLGERPLLAVQRLHLLARLRAADLQVRALEQRHVERVQRMPHSINT